MMIFDDICFTASLFAGKLTIFLAICGDWIRVQANLSSGRELLGVSDGVGLGLMLNAALFGALR